MSSPTSKASKQTKTSKQRLDQWLVDSGLCATRSKAQGLILSGMVRVNDTPALKAGQPVCDLDTVTVKETQRYVGRGGQKLEGALESFQIDVTGLVGLDIGASTGGFTDCLLQHGARHVVALDVGYGQLDWSLRQDERVTVMERTHFKTLPDLTLPVLPDIVVVDVSFISVKKVFEPLHAALGNHPHKVITLLKPQFEYKDYCNPKGFDGIVRETDDLRQIVLGVLTDIATQTQQYSVRGLINSPISGQKGNREFLVFWAFNDDLLQKDKSSTQAHADDLLPLVDSVLTPLA